MTQDEIKFYTYAHFKKDDLKIFYIGKGKKDRETVRTCPTEFAFALGNWHCRLWHG